VGPKKHVLDEGPDPPWEGAILRGKGRPVKYREYHILNKLLYYLVKYLCSKNHHAHLELSEAICHTSLNHSTAVE